MIERTVKIYDQLVIKITGGADGPKDSVPVHLDIRHVEDGHQIFAAWLSEALVVELMDAMSEALCDILDTKAGG